MEKYIQLRQQALEMIKSVLPNVKVENEERIYSFTFGDGQRGTIRVDRKIGYSSTRKPISVNIEITNQHGSNYGDTNERTVRKYVEGASSSLTYTKAQKERLVEIAERVKRADENSLKRREYEAEQRGKREAFKELLESHGYDIAFSSDYHSDINGSLRTTVLTSHASATFEVTTDDIELLIKLREVAREHLGEK